MIIQVRGTSGSGKTWVMNQLFGILGPLVWQPIYTGTRRRPLYYKGWSSIYLLGSYETACGGCDGIGSAKAVFDQYESILKADEKAVILSEGLLLSEDVKWTKEAFDRGWDPRVIYLTTHIEACVTQVKHRRKAAGNDKPFNETNTRGRVKVIEKSKLKLESEGVVCRYVTASASPDLIKEWISAN